MPLDVDQPRLDTAQAGGPELAPTAPHRADLARHPHDHVAFRLCPGTDEPSGATTRTWTSSVRPVAVPAIVLVCNLRSRV